MVKGIRLTTGAEFALRDARRARCSSTAWSPWRARSFRWASASMQNRGWGGGPCLPDMLPMIGRAPKHEGLWMNFGHHHLGFTMGPVTGRLLAEMLTGEAPVHRPGALPGGPVLTAVLVRRKICFGGGDIPSNTRPARPMSGD
jgi:D-amino-acid dehydrogenase